MKRLIQCAIASILWGMMVHFLNREWTAVATGIGVFAGLYSMRLLYVVLGENNVY